MAALALPNENNSSCKKMLFVVKRAVALWTSGHYLGYYNGGTKRTFELFAFLQRVVVAAKEEPRSQINKTAHSQH